MKSLTDYWRTKFVELQKLANEDKKKTNSEKKELKDKIFEQTATIKELQNKISELEKAIAESEKIISKIEPDKEAIFENHKKEIETIKKENAENILLIEQKGADYEAILISEFARFLKKDIGFVDGMIRVLGEICRDKKAKKVIENLIEHLERMSQLAEELSWFSKPFKKEKGLTEVAYLLEKVVGEFKDDAAAKNIKISVDVTEKIPEVSIFEEHLKTAFTEIIKNSFDAMYQGGLLSIKIYPSADGGVIEFSDTGRGIPSHLLEKVTKPFFSTKKKIGFGLGMTKVRKILDTYGYRFTISSEEDKGTTVKIWIK